MKKILPLTLALLWIVCGTTDETNSSNSRICGKMTAERLTAITHGNGRFVAVGSNGIIVTSTDGSRWSEVASGGRNLQSVAWGNNRFVAIGDSCGTLTSGDGIHWTQQAISPVDRCLTSPSGSITYGNNQFVAAVSMRQGTSGAAGNHTAVFTSADGIAWNPQSVDQNTPLYALAYGNSTFVGVGGCRALASSDGINWIPFTVEPDSVASLIHLNSVIWGGNQFVALGMNSLLYTSPDGKTWTKRDTRVSYVDFVGAVWQGNHYTVIGYKNNCPYDDSVKIATSSDGVNWTSFLGWTAPSSAAVVTAFTYGDGAYVAVGRNGLVSSSSDGIAWESRSSVSAEIFHDICWNGGQFIAVGTSGMIISSMNGVQWQQTSSVTTSDLSATVGGNGCFVAVGAVGAICASADGADWTAVSSPAQNDLSDIAWGNGRFVAVGEKRIIISSVDGFKWEIAFTADETMLAGSGSRVTYGKYGFVTINNTGEMFTSTDGVEWKIGNVARDGSYSDVEWGSDKYVVVGHTASNAVFFLASADGQIWTDRQSIPQSPMLSCVNIRWGADQFVVLDGNMPACSIYSADGLAWSLLPDPCAFSGFNAFAYDGTKYVFVGGGGVVSTSPPF